MPPSLHHPGEMEKRAPSGGVCATAQAALAPLAMLCYNPPAMMEFRLIFKFLDRDFVFKLIFLLLAYSLIPLAEIFLFLYLGDLIGNYLILALAATVGLIGVLLALREIQKTLDNLKKKIRKNQYPGKEFVDLVGILVGSIFLLTPGFITDFIGFLLLIPYFRDILGRAIAKRLDKKFKEIYEYLKLYDL